MNQRIRRSIAALGSSAILALLAACGGGGSSNTENADWRTAASGTPEVTEISVGSEPSALYLPLHAAISEGFFEEEGLTATPVPITGAPESVAALAGGDLQFTPLSFFYVFSMDESRPVELDFVQGIDTAKGGGGFVTDEPSIASASDLAGKKVATPSVNSACNLAGGTVLSEEYGVDVSTIEWVELKGSDVPAALERNTVDAACTSATNVTSLVQGGATELASINEGPTENLPILAYWGSRDFTRKNPNTSAAFMRAMAKANDWVNQNPEKAREMLVSDIGIPEEIAADMTLPTFGAPSDDAIQSAADILQDQGVVKNELDVPEIIGR